MSLSMICEPSHELAELLDKQIEKNGPPINLTGCWVSIRADKSQRYTIEIAKAEMEKKN